MYIHFNIPTTTPSTSVLVEEIDLVPDERNVRQMGKDLIKYCRFCPSYILDSKFDQGNRINLVGVLLDIQITGVQNIIDKYQKWYENGIGKVTYTLNGFLGMIFECITFWGGDVVSIHGDRCLNVWQLSKEETLYEVLHNVVLCSCFIQKVIAEFNSLVSQNLNLKISISCGNFYSIYQGEENKLLVLRGEPILEIHRLGKLTKPGEIFISYKAWAHMIKHRYHIDKVDRDTIRLKSCKAAYKANDRRLNQDLYQKEMKLSALIAIHIEFMKTMQYEEMKNPTLKSTSFIKDLEKRLPARPIIDQVLRTGRAANVRQYVPKLVLHQINIHQPVEYLTLFTTVISQVIVIKPNAPESLSDVFIALCYKKLGSVIANTDTFIYRFEVTTKIRIIVLSGVEAVTKGTESKCALRCSYQIKEIFQDVPGIGSITIGVFNEYLYCGVVGHPFRHEYVVLGMGLYQAYKILEHNKGKVICDYKTFQFSKLSSAFFRCIGKKKCKLHMDAGQLMEYSESVDKFQEFYESPIKIIGRDEEIARTLKIIYSGSKTTHGVIISGGNKIGKHTLLQHIVNILYSDQDILCLTLKVLNEQCIPFLAICHIYSQLYRYQSKKDTINMEKFCQLPRRLIDNHEYSDVCEDDINIFKYRVLNSVRTLFNLCHDQLIVIAIRNMHVMDTMSWDILDSLMSSCNFRIVATANIDYKKATIHFEEDERFEVIIVEPLPDDLMIRIACRIMGVTAIKERLAHFLINVCRGYPGFLSNCIFYFINYDDHQLNFIRKPDLSEEFLIVGEISALPNHAMVLVPKTAEHLDYTEESNEFIRDTIVKGIYLALLPREQLMIKTAAVLGPVFSRDLLALALYSPPPDEFQAGIENFFEEGFFECGSAYVNSCDNVIGTSCRCLKTEEEIQILSQSDVPSYRFCKLLHFKDIYMQKIAYSMLTAVQRRDLHMLCTDVLENTVHYCPTCLRDPVNSFMVAPRYEEIMQYCSGTELSMTMSRGAPKDILKDCIRDKLFNPCQCNKKTDCVYVTPIRTGYDPNRCRCLDMLLSVFQALAYHSKTGKHIGKEIFYLSVYGYLLIVAKDVPGGISILREAFELCMVDINSPKCQISTNYRKFSVGRICMMLACGMIQIRKINQAKAQVTLALRQYNIPLVSFRYHHLQCFLRRRYLSAFSRNHAVHIRHTWARWEVGMCFILCSKVFAMEGNLQNAKHCAKYCLWLLKQLNERVPMLFESYCTVVNLYRYGLDHKICEKLQKYTTRELLLNYFNDRGYYAKHLVTLMTVEFEMSLLKGNIPQSVTLCYRIVDTILKLFVYASVNEMAHWFSVVFGYTLRFRQLVDIMCVIRKNESVSSMPLWYFTNALDVTLQTGYSFVPMRPLIKELNSLLNYTKLDNLSWEANYLLSLLYLHTVKDDSMRAAEKFKPLCVFTALAIKRPYVLRALLNIIEANLMDIYYRQVDGMSYTRLEYTIDQYLELAKIGVKDQPIFFPRYHCLKAWKCRLNNDMKKMHKELQRAAKISRTQGNLLFVQYVHRLRSYWTGDKIADAYSAHINVTLGEVMHLKDSQWAIALQPYPVVIQTDSETETSE